MTTAATYTIIKNELHAKKFANTWKYNESILKEYNVYVELLYVPGGGKFKRGSFISAYNENEACEKAIEKITLREGDKILTVQAICTNTAAPTAGFFSK